MTGQGIDNSIWQKDSQWYSEPDSDHVKTSDPGILPRLYGKFRWVNE